MIFKEPELREQFWKLTPKARLLMCYADYLSQGHMGKPIIVTCIYYKGGSGVHAVWRAFDIRTEDYYEREDIMKLVEFVNEHYPYDKRRPRMKSAIYHKVNSKKIKDYKLKNFVPQYHLHFQVWGI